MKEKSVSKKELFETMPVGKALAQMAVPTIIGQLIVLIYNLADTFFIGQTGNPYMVAAASLVLPLFNISNAMSNLVGIGAGSLISRLLGQKREQDASKVSVFAVYFALALAACWGLIIGLLIHPVLYGLGAGENTVAFARTYCIWVVVIGGIPTIVQLTMAQLLRAVGLSKEAGFGISMGGILNIALDPLLMFVLLPKGNEIAGAGAATMLSNLISMIYFIFMISRASKTTVLRLSPKTGMADRNLVKQIISVGVPACVSNLLFDVSQMMINRLMSAYGDIPLAACGIVLKAERIPLNTGVGICQGMMPIIAYNYASGNYERMKKTMNTARNAGLLVSAVCIVFYELCASGLMHLFIAHEQTAELGASFLRARCLATPFMFINFHFVYSFQAMGRAKISFWLAVIRQLALYIPLLLLMNHLYGMYGLVWTQLVSDSIMIVVSIAVYRHFEKDVLQKVH